MELQAGVFGDILDDVVPYTPAGIGYLTAALAFLLSTLLIFIAAKRGRVAFETPVLAFVAADRGFYPWGPPLCL